MCKYTKTQVSQYDPTKHSNHSIFRPEDDLLSKCDQNSKKAVSFDNISHLIHKENIETYLDFDCGITFQPEAPTKVRQNNCERN